MTAERAKEIVDNELDKFSIPRWIALADCVNLIYDTAEKNGIDADTVTLKQNHIVKYIDEVTEKIKLI